MGVPILIIGQSGSGKSASLRNCVGGDFAVINVLGKQFPFRGKIPTIMSDDYDKVKQYLANKKMPNSIIIDDAGYLITNMFMRGHSKAGAGNAIFAFYNDLGDYFWQLIEFIKHNLPAEKIVYLMMHEDTNDFGQTKPKTIGRMLDEKVCVEGLFTIVLRCMKSNGRHIFRTQTDGLDVAKTPIDMFAETEIDNDLAMVDATIREYYELNKKTEKGTKKTKEENNE